MNSKHPPTITIDDPVRLKRIVNKSRDKLSEIERSIEYGIRKLKQAYTPVLTTKPKKWFGLVTGKSPLEQMGLTEVTEAAIDKWRRREWTNDRINGFHATFGCEAIREIACDSKRPYTALSNHVELGITITMTVKDYDNLMHVEPPEAEMVFDWNDWPAKFFVKMKNKC